MSLDAWLADYGTDRTPREGAPEPFRGILAGSGDAGRARVAEASETASEGQPGCDERDERVMDRLRKSTSHELWPRKGGVVMP